MKLVDLTGKRFERLTAVRVSGHKPVKWECVCDCGNVVNVSAGNLTKKTNPTRSCGCLWASDIKNEVGKIMDSNSGKFEIIELLGGEKVLCKFEDGNTVVAQKGNIRIGNVWNPYRPFVYGVGFVGVGNYSTKIKAHNYWSKMMQRAYCPVYKEEHPTYDDVTVSSEWLNYQNFAEWCTKRKQYGNMGFNLDKDIIIRGNKLYSEDRCSLVPQRINKLLVTKESVGSDAPLGVKRVKDKFGRVTGYTANCHDNGKELYFGYYSNPTDAFFAYKVGKESLIKRVAEECKDTLDEQVYDALMKYVVVDANGIIKNDETKGV